MKLKPACFILAVTVIYGCSTIKDSPNYILSDGKYTYKQPHEKFRKVYVYVKEDSVSIFQDEQGTQPIIPIVLKDEFFLKRSLDINVQATPFKFRQASVNLPQQLTTDFNGSIFVGYRFDRFRLVHKHTPIGWKRYYKHRGISFGAFGGLGSATVTPWTTNNMITDEYSGVVLNRGGAIMFGINNLNVGVGIGWDSLTDRDKAVWIYQNKPWYGLMIGLNLN